eukprot:m.62475 g.62475  ORF g.62475 m.62475 type:complete len:431 (-) comp23161_c0_seq1:111-1403(-)
MSVVTTSATGVAIECPIAATTNTFAVVTAVGGLLGLIACICVLVVIYAYKKDKYFVRERIILGLVFVSALYSIFNIVPVWGRDPESCQTVLPNQHLHYLRMTWFAWKFAIVCYEIFIISFSIYALRLQNPVQTVPLRIEVLGHSLCWLVAAFIGIYSCLHVKPLVRQITAYFEGKPMDAACDFACVDKQYQLFVSQLNVGSNVLVLIAIVLWLVMRFGILLPLRRHWNSSYSIASNQWSKDYWDKGSQSQLETKQKLMYMQQRNFEDVAQPLERYVWVFIVFLPAAVVLALPYCADHTSLFETCQAPTEMVLSFRSLATCAVYFMDTECRAQLRNTRLLCRKVGQRARRVRRRYTVQQKSVSGSVHWADKPDQIKIVERVDYESDDHDDDHVDNHDHDNNDGGNTEINQCLLVESETFATNQDYQLMVEP